jgi:hypothetical protein
MLSQLFPQRVDNRYCGHKLALWLFALLVLFKITMSLNCIFNGYSVATSADGLPLDTYTPACAQTVVANFATWGLMQLMVCLVCIMVLIRYRAMIPFMLALLLLEHLSRRLILHFLPVVKPGAPPGYAVNLALLTLTLVGLALSLWRRNKIPIET